MEPTNNNTQPQPAQSKVSTATSQSVDSSAGVPVANGVTIEAPKQKKKMNKGLKIALCILIPIVAIIAIVAIILTVAFNSNSKMVCNAKDDMSITIYFNDEKVVGYTAVNMSYDFDKQQAYSQKVGINTYLAEFQKNFKADFSGTCQVETK